ncbi:Maf family protein [Sodalis-like endosymbiont of Proechinophthirus fluctus]|uniref:Maf family protein n=1 Tax=Sodalis-like endosymbiont of Proechinophthirus fluctus TaxID=1462730 RepID=UPI000834BA28|nr:Maf family protein [Sodalis-like endosymbiont of Proechinophthirus fluctus]
MRLQHARQILTPGQCYQVMTSVSLSYTSRIASRLVVTEVAFLALTSAEIEYYIACGEPMDKVIAFVHSILSLLRDGENH